MVRVIVDEITDVLPWFALEGSRREADGSRGYQTDLCQLFQCLRLYLQVVFYPTTPACDQLPQYRLQGPRLGRGGWHRPFPAPLPAPLPGGGHRSLRRYAQEGLEEGTKIRPDQGQPHGDGCLTLGLQRRYLRLCGRRLRD